MYFVNSDIIIGAVTAKKHISALFFAVFISSLFGQQTLSISASPDSIAENGGSATFTITVSNPSGGAISGYIVYFGTALLYTDYQTTAGYFTIYGGSTSTTFTVTAIPDYLQEGDETIVASISNVSGATVGSPASAMVTIIDSYVPPSGNTPYISFAVPAIAVNEAVGTVTLTAVLSETSANHITAAANFTGTAVMPDDFTVNAQTFDFPPNATSSSITLNIVDDPYYEGTETIFAGLTNINGALLGQPASTEITIADNDPSTAPPPPVSGIDEVSELDKIYIYPNPANDVVYIATPAVFCGGEYRDSSGNTIIVDAECGAPYFVEMFNMLGEKVQEMNVNVSAAMNVSNLSAGNYILRFKNEETGTFIGTKPLVIAGK